ncbi:uncharacterized protein LOC131020875 [Salvia miltiorrhiza]|uniref:uncharacterized protein LOC131020875 n=1 Tax=Salvia miltiorrhiza TaxID=226208 RepID=UPI0025ACB8CE|nr:uncharacterized protein LOC131020875 [Salvia miltiorrhiza]
MASSNSKALHHNRSLSFPSKENPSTSHLNESLANARGRDAAASSSSSSLSSMKTRAKCITNLYNDIDDLLQMPHTHHIITQERSIDHLLDGYIGVLDACTAAKDLVSNTKHDVQGLLSALRRKDAAGIASYLASTKLSRKSIHKSLKQLRSCRSNKHMICNNNLPKCGESELVHKLKEAESVAIAMLESLMSYLGGNKMQAASKSGWSLVTKVMLSKKREDSDSDSDSDSNEFKKIDALLQKSLEGMQVMNLSKEVDSSIQDLEEELECLFRQLIRTRVLLLNILNN